MDTHKQKIAHLKSLYHLASVDNFISPEERMYIEVVAEKLGVDLNELKMGDVSEPELELPDREYKLYSLFHRLVIILTVDGNVSDEEKRYCFSLGIKMGLHPNAIAEIMDHIITRGPMKALPQEITAIFRKYMS